jgi:hypothetical protein
VKKRKIHIIFLVIFHLLVFIIPLTVKSAHHHSFQSHVSNKEGSCEYSKVEKRCLICQFEFVIGNVNRTTSNYIYLPIVLNKNAELVSQFYTEAYSYSSLRAPPIC